MATRTIANAGGNWSATATWVEGAVPTSVDDVVATATSGALTVDANANALTVDFTNYVSTFTHTSATTLNIYGTKFKLVSGMTFTTGVSASLAFPLTGGTCLFTTAGKTFAQNVFFAQAGTLSLQDNATFTANISVTGGTFTTNNHNVTAPGILGSTSATTYNLGSSVITLNGTNTTVWSVIATSTINAGTSTITASGTGAYFSGGGKTYNTLSLTGSGSQWVAGANTFATLTRTGTATTTDQVGFASSQTITGTLTLTGNSITNRLYVGATGDSSTYSNMLGYGQQTITLTAAVVSLTNVDIQDVTAAGVASPFTGTSVGLMGNTTNITGTVNSGTSNGAGGVNRYAVVAGNFSSTATWSTTSGGAGGATVPLPQDSIILDASSAAGTYTANVPRIGNITCTGFVQTLTLNTTLWIAGNATLVSSMTYNNGNKFIVFCGRGSQTITSGNKNWVGTATAYFVAGIYTFQDNQAFGAVSLWGGTLVDNAKTVSISQYFLTTQWTLPRTITFTGTWNFTGSSQVLYMNQTGLTITGTGFIFNSTPGANSQTWDPGGYSLGNINLNSDSGGTTTLLSSNTWKNFTIIAGTAARTFVFQAGTTQTVTKFKTWGIAGTSVPVLQSSSAGTQWTISQASGYSWNDFTSFQDANATGGASFYAGANSTNVSNNTGWTFATYPIPMAAATSTSSSSMSLTAPTTVPVANATSTSSSSMSLTAPTTVPVANATSTSSSSMTVTANTAVPLAAATSTSSSSMVVRTTAQITPASATSVSSASMNLMSSITGTSNSTSSSSMTLHAPTRVLIRGLVSTSSSKCRVSIKTPVTTQPAVSTSTSTLALDWGLHPAVVQSYQFTPVAAGYSPNGLSVISAGSPLADRIDFDVIAAMAAIYDYDAIINADNPVSYWTLNDLSGTSAVDQKGLGNGTYQNRYFLGQPGALIGRQDYSLLLDGSSGYVSLPNLTQYRFNTATAFSVEAWVNFDELQTGGIVTRYDNSFLGWTLSYFAGTTQTVQFGIGPTGGGGANAVGASGAFQTGVWYHLVGVWDGSYIYLYVNGVLQQATSLSSPPGLGANAPSIGRLQWFYAVSGGQDLLAGNIERVALYNHALTAVQVQNHYTAGDFLTYGVLYVCDNALKQALDGSSSLVRVS